MSLKKFTNFTLFILFYLILVILFGAWVRTSLSGAGCGDHWPLCNGSALPISGSIKTWIEFTHRITSGISGFFILGLTLWGFKVFPKKHPGRFLSVGVLVFILLEGAIGALLVKRGLVTTNQSLERAIVIALHLINTQILLGFLTGVIFFAKFFHKKITQVPKLLSFILGLLLCVSASGAIVAMGDLIFPAHSLIDSIKQDFSATSHWLIRLRIIHPVLAISASVVIYIYCQLESKIKLKSTLQWIIFLQVCVGLLNVILLAPAWIQILHLGMASVVWILVVWIWFSSATLDDQTGRLN